MSTDADPAREKAKEKAKTLFEYGNKAAMSSNFDYAINMYQNCCKLEPDNLIYRQALRGIERRKFENNPGKVGRMAAMSVQKIRLGVKMSKSKGNWKAVLETCEEAFVLNPWDVGTARDAAEACEHLEYLLMAQWLLESVQAQATEADFFRQLAHVEELNAAWQKAIQAWERVKKLDPNDETASRKINALSADATIQRAGLGEAIDKRNEAASAPATPDASELEAQVMKKLSPEQRLVKEIELHPDRIGPHLELADMLRQRGQLEEAEKALARGMKAHPDDEALKIAFAEVQIARLQGYIERLTRKTIEKPADATAKAQLQQCKDKLLAYELKEFRRRAQLNPQELGLQLQIGKRLAAAGKHQEAIGAFQQARNHAESRVEALHQAGLSFEAIGNHKLAERNYQDALKSVESTNIDTLNALHYRLGRVAEALGNTSDAEEHYNEVAANDYSYLDVADRLKNLGL